MRFFVFFFLPSKKHLIATADCTCALQMCVLCCQWLPGINKQHTCASLFLAPSLFSLLYTSSLYLTPFSLFLLSPPLHHCEPPRSSFNFCCRLANPSFHHIKFLSCLKFDSIWVMLVVVILGVVEIVTCWWLAGVLLSSSI